MGTSDAIISESEDILVLTNNAVEDFELTYLDKPIYSNHQYYDRGELTVLKKTSQREKTYTTGHGSSWQAELEIDLRNKYY